MPRRIQLELVKLALGAPELKGSLMEGISLLTVKRARSPSMPSLASSRASLNTTRQSLSRKIQHLISALRLSTMFQLVVLSELLSQSKWPSPRKSSTNRIPSLLSALLSAVVRTQLLKIRSYLTRSRLSISNLRSQVVTRYSLTLSDSRSRVFALQEVSDRAQSSPSLL